MNGENEEFWEELYKVDADEEWINGAYDEHGEQVQCDWCHENLSWNPETRIWYCRNCSRKISRAEWFNWIGAYRMPGPKCLSQCEENYPMCKSWCALYKIPEDDPFFD